jgi:hypothetical protein
LLLGTEEIVMLVAAIRVRERDGHWGLEVNGERGGDYDRAQAMRIAFSAARTAVTTGWARAAEVTVDAAEGGEPAVFYFGLDQPANDQDTALRQPAAMARGPSAAAPRL